MMSVSHDMFRRIALVGIILNDWNGDALVPLVDAGHHSKVFVEKPFPFEVVLDELCVLFQHIQHNNDFPLLLGWGRRHGDDCSCALSHAQSSSSVEAFYFTESNKTNRYLVLLEDKENERTNGTTGTHSSAFELINVSCDIVMTSRKIEADECVLSYCTLRSSATMADHTLQPSMHIAFVGDSDISRWPKELAPSIQRATVSIQGYSGAILNQIVPAVEACLLERYKADLVVLVICPGENDFGEGYSFIKSEQAFERLLEITFNRDNREMIRLIFLGPKFEPWLADDADSRKQYVKMSMTFERCCKDHTLSRLISFIDCLPMFCGESGTQPGAVLGGRALAERRYFDSDQIHLSQDGYGIWKQVIEDCALNI